MSDARFADGAERPIKLFAHDREDTEIVSALIQDAIAERKEMLWEPERRSFSLLLRRFRWEDAEDAKAQNREFERVQSVLSFNSVLSVQYSGFETSDQNLAFDLIGLIVNEDDIRIAFAGNGEIKLNIEAIDIYLSDVSRPYVAQAKEIPDHKEG